MQESPKMALPCRSALKSIASRLRILNLDPSRKPTGDLIPVPDAIPSPQQISVSRTIVLRCHPTLPVHAELLFFGVPNCRDAPPRRDHPLHCPQRPSESSAKSDRGQPPCLL